MTMTIATHRATTPTTRARATRRATRPRERTTRRASSSSETKTAATAATTTRREEDDDAGVERAASTTGAERVIPEPTREARGVECVGVGMEASCDAEALADEAGASAGASAGGERGGERERRRGGEFGARVAVFSVGDVDGGDERGFAGDVADVRRVGAIDSVGVDFSGVGAE